MEQNVHSDSDFTKETLQSLGKQKEPVMIVADGSFGGTENIRLAKKNNIDLVTTNLTGKAANDIDADFEFNEDGTKVLKCPGGRKPKSCSYNQATGQCIVSFHRSQCMGCPHFKECHPAVKKRTCRKSISAKSKQHA